MTKINFLNQLDFEHTNRYFPFPDISIKSIKNPSETVLKVYGISYFMVVNSPYSKWICFEKGLIQRQAVE